MRSDETLELYGTDWLTDWTLDTYVEELITLERVAARPGEAHDALQLEQCPGQCALRPIRQKFAQDMGFHVEKKRWVRCPKCAHWTCTGCAKNLLSGKPADIALGSDPKSRPAEWQFKCIVCSQNPACATCSCWGACAVTTACPTKWVRRPARAASLRTRPSASKPRQQQSTTLTASSNLSTRRRTTLPRRRPRHLRRRRRLPDLVLGIRRPASRGA